MASFSYTPPSGNTFPIGTTIVYCPATGNACNTANSNFTTKANLGPFYLHNYPTLSTGNIRFQRNLPMGFVTPTTTFFCNYDTDRDAFPGCLIQKHSGDANQ